MSRGYNGPEIGDFRGSGFDWERGSDRDPSSGWNSWLALHHIHREEDRADRRDSEARERGEKDRPPVPREERVRQVLSQRVRTKYTDRTRQYSLRDSEINTLGEVGKFRVVGMNEKARAGFELYARRGETDRLRRIRDGQELSATIFRL